MFCRATVSRLAIATFAVVSLAGVASAQNFPKPAAEHARLAQMEGKWDCVMDMEGQKSKCSATYKSICGGMWIESDFEGDLGGIKFQGHGLDGYDLAKKKYVGVWVDSMASSTLLMEGDYDEKSKKLTMVGSGPGPDGKPQKVRNVTEYKDKDHFTFKMYMVDLEGKEQLAFTIEYTRKK
jgi:hypothetical protein